MNLLAALFMAQILYVIGVGGTEDPELCISLAFSLQYVRLTVFCWIAAMTHDMYTTFKNNINLVPSTDPKIGTSFWKYSLFSWGCPLFMLTSALGFQFRQRHGNLLDVSNLKRLNCWFLERDAVIYGSITPSVILLVIIVVYLVRSAVVIRYTVSMQVDRRVRDKMRRQRRLQLFLFVKITLLVTFVTGCGALAALTHMSGFWIAYNVGHGLQGIIVALLVTCNCQVLKIYTRNLRKKRLSYYGTGKNGYTAAPESDLSKSTSLQLLTWEPVPDAV